MGALMCVDIDLNLDATGNGVSSNEESDKPDVVEILESEVREAIEKGSDTLRWLELDCFDIDDDMLLSLELPTRFPVCNSFINSFYFFSLLLRAICFIEHIQIIMLMKHRDLMIKH